MKQQTRRFSKLTLIVFVLLSMLSGVDAQNSPNTPPAPPTDAPWYVPGPVRGFVGSVVIGHDGRVQRFGTRQIYGPGTSEFATPLDYINGPFLGQSNLWFGGNAALAQASSVITSTQPVTYTVCGKVTKFLVTKPNASTNGNLACELRYANTSWQWVVTGTLSLWSGCPIVRFHGNLPHKARNDTYHSYLTGTNQPVQGDSFAETNYGCRAQ